MTSGVWACDAVEAAERAQGGRALGHMSRQERGMHGQVPDLEIGKACNAVLISLLKTLIDKNVLSNADVRALLTRAASDLGPHEYAVPLQGAIGIILDDVLPIFPEDGGD
jgi:hypothetical protein